MAQPFIGEIRMWGGTFAPVGWLLCDGSLQPIFQYDTLFNLIGTTYGGDGQSTFGLPDLRGRLPIHMGQGTGLPSFRLGQIGGNANTTITPANLPPHNHTNTFTPSNVVQPTATAQVMGSSAAGNPGGRATPYIAGSTATGGTDIYSNQQIAPQNIAGVSAQLTAGDPMGQATITVTPAGNSIPLATTPPYLVITFIIATAGIYPSQ
jgi:microcystin-dependent protein